MRERFNDPPVDRQPRGGRGQEGSVFDGKQFEKLPDSELEELFSQRDSLLATYDEAADRALQAAAPDKNHTADMKLKTQEALMDPDKREQYQTLRNQFVMAHMGDILTITRGYEAQYGLPKDTLVMVASEAAMNAFRKYDPSRDTHESIAEGVGYFVKDKSRKAIHDELNALSGGVITRKAHVTQEARTVRKTEDHLQSVDGTAATHQEVADWLEIDADRVRRLQNLPTTYGPDVLTVIKKISKEAGNANMGTVEPLHAAEIVDMLESPVILQKLISAIGSQDPHYADIIIGRLEGKTTKQLCEELDLKSHQVTSLQEKASQAIMNEAKATIPGLDIDVMWASYHLPKILNAIAKSVRGGR